MCGNSFSAFFYHTMFLQPFNGGLWGDLSDIEVLITLMIYEIRFHFTLLNNVSSQYPGSDISIPLSQLAIAIELFVLYSFPPINFFIVALLLFFRYLYYRQIHLQATDFQIQGNCCLRSPIIQVVLFHVLQSPQKPGSPCHNPLLYCSIHHSALRCHM